MHNFNKRDFSLKVSKQKNRIQTLIQQFNQQLKISQTYTKSPNSQRSSDRHLPLIQQRTKLHADRFISEKLQYQRNLHTIIDQIKDKMENTRKSPAFLSTKRRKQHRFQSPIDLLNKTQFKIHSMNIVQDNRHKIDVTKSYIQATQKKLAQQKRRKRLRYQRFNFEPWVAMEESEAIQTIDL